MLSSGEVVEWATLATASDVAWKVPALPRFPLFPTHFFNTVSHLLVRDTMDMLLVLVIDFKISTTLSTRAKQPGIARGCFRFMHRTLLGGWEKTLMGREAGCRSSNPLSQPHSSHYLGCSKDGSSEYSSVGWLKRLWLWKFCRRERSSPLLGRIRGWSHRRTTGMDRLRFSLSFSSWFSSSCGIWWSSCCARMAERSQHACCQILDEVSAFLLLIMVTCKF